MNVFLSKTKINIWTHEARILQRLAKALESSSSAKNWSDPEQLSPKESILVCKNIMVDLNVLLLSRAAWIVALTLFFLKLLWPPLNRITTYGKLQDRSIQGLFSHRTTFTAIYVL